MAEFYPCQAGSINVTINIINNRKKKIKARYGQVTDKEINQKCTSWNGTISGAFNGIETTVWNYCPWELEH